MKGRLVTVSPLRLGALALTALSAAACTPASVTSATNNFERATDVEFICLEFPSARPPAPGEDAGCLRNDAGMCVQQNIRRLFPYALPLSACQINDADNTSTAFNRNLFALVTQSNRGELALVNLTTSSGTSLFDNSPGVPGYSFIPVGRSPTAIVADVRAAPSENADAVSSVWIASAADKTVQRIDARMLTLDPRSRQADGLRGSMRVNGALRDITLNAEPRDLAIDTVNGRQLLYVTLPSVSEVAVYDITDPTNAQALERIAITAPPPPPDAGDAAVDARDGSDASDAGDASDASDGSLDGGDAGDPDASLDGGDAGSPEDVLDARPPLDREEAGAPDVSMDGGELDGATGDVPAGGRARPSRLVVDRRTHTVYLNDESSTWVHILRGSPARVVDRLDVGVPTRALALSGWARAEANPAVATDPDHSALAQYLYVVSATDGAVYAFDLVRRARINANLLPSPNPLRRRLDPALPDHRVAVSFPATALLPISSREYTEPSEGDPPTITPPAECLSTAGCRGTSAVGTTYLHGVFMGVVLRDGRLSIIDIDDYDAPARVEADATRTGAYRFIRHAPRLREPFQQAPGIRNAPTLTESPQEGQRVPVLESRRSPTISCVERRTADGMNVPCRGDGLEYENYGVELVASPVVSDGGTGDAAVDASDGASAGSPASADPYALRNETWALTYEETLPGLDLSGGAFSVNAGGELLLDQPGAAFCTRGALVDETTRDQVEVVSDPTPLPQFAARCADLFGPGATMNQRTYARNRTLQITRATQDRLTLSPVGDVAPARFAECFPQATRFRVRVGGQWLVQGSVSGFVHSVRADSTGVCVIDEERQRLIENLATQCLTRRAPLSVRASDWCGEGRACRCPAGRACMGRPDTAGTITASTTPVFANPFFCLQVFPATVAYTGTRPCDPIGAQVSGPGQNPAWVVCSPGRDVRFTFAISGAWAPLDLGNGSGSFVTSARFLPTLDRLYVVDTQALGLVEFKTNPLARLRLFN
jgi:hypothetical protein